MNRSDAYATMLTHNADKVEKQEEREESNRVTTS